MISGKENELYQRAARYCGYQERTEKEMREKLRTWGATQKEAAHTIQTLKAENFLDEERYVEAFISGKSVAKKWGKRKLSTALTMKGVDQALIHQGLAAIEPTAYLQRLRYVADKKKRTLTGATAAQLKQKLTNYLLQKGYEPDLVIQTIQDIIVQ